MESAECKGNATFHRPLPVGRSFHERVFSRSGERDFLRKIEKNDGHLIRKEMSKLWNKARMTALSGICHVYWRRKLGTSMHVRDKDKKKWNEDDSRGDIRYSIRLPNGVIGCRMEA